MSSSGGASLNRRRIRVLGERAASVVSALAEAQGHEVVSEDTEVDLIVLEANCLEDLRAPETQIPILVVAGRRLRDSEVRDFERAGATRVIDSDSSLLDVAFAFSDMLFSTLHEQRRYGRQHGGMSVRFREADALEEASVPGRLVGVARNGAFIQTEHPLPEGAAIDIEVEIGSIRSVAFRGRVVCVSDCAGGGIGVEFALDHHEVAPKLYGLCPQHKRLHTASAVL